MDKELIEKCLPTTAEIYGIFNECIPFIGAKDRRNEAVGKLYNLFEAQLTNAIPIIAEEMRSEAGVKECIDSIIKRELKAQAEEIKRKLEKLKGLGYSNESCFHITDKDWQSYWGGK